MKLLIKQRVFSWSDTYDVYDENGNAKYYVKAEFLSIGHKIHVYNCFNNQEVGVVRERILTFLPKFEIQINGRTVGTIQKEFTFFKPKYSIDCNGWHVDGNFLGWDYDVTSGCSKIMHISKEILHWGDTYAIYFQNPADEIMGLLLVIAIDAANCSENN